MDVLHAVEDFPVVPTGMIVEPVILPNTMWKPKIPPNPTSRIRPQTPHEVGEFLAGQEAEDGVIVVRHNDEGQESDASRLSQMAEGFDKPLGRGRHGEDGPASFGAFCDEVAPIRLRHPAATQTFRMRIAVLRDGHVMFLVLGQVVRKSLSPGSMARCRSRLQPAIFA